MWRLPALLRCHALQVYFDDFSLENAEVALGADVGFVCATGADDADRGVVDRELFVLLERFTQCVQAVLDELLQCACKISILA